MALSLGSLQWAPSSSAPHVVIEGRLTLDTDALAAVLVLPSTNAPGALDGIGEFIENGLRFGNIEFGLEGTPSGPFIGNFYYANEIRFRGVDPESVASSIMFRASVTLD